MDNHKSSQAVLQRTRDIQHQYDWEEHESKSSMALLRGFSVQEHPVEHPHSQGTGKKRWDKVFSQALCSSKWAFTVLPRFLGSSPFPLK